MTLNKSNLKVIYNEVASTIGLNKEMPKEFDFWRKILSRCTTFSHEFATNDLRNHLDNVPESRLDLVTHRVSSPSNVAASLLYRSNSLCFNKNNIQRFPVVVNPFYGSTSFGNAIHWEGEARRVAEKLSIGALDQKNGGVFIQVHHRFNNTPSVYNHSHHQVLTQPMVLECRFDEKSAIDIDDSFIQPVVESDLALRIQKDVLLRNILVDGFSVCDTTASPEEAQETGDIRGLYCVKDDHDNLMASVQVSAMTDDGKLILTTPSIFEDSFGLDGFASLVKGLRNTFTAKTIFLSVDSRDAFVPHLKELAQLVQPDPIKRTVRSSGVTITAMFRNVDDDLRAKVMMTPMAMSAELLFREVWKDSNLISN
eukprot:GDKJ01017483.1.p1 GENE.GDKJ01017483.1~~GDKJ01017483.1.p1  ORF type:complete len:375 (-),score=54.74 GDKJ01017483.1:37-1140(-)